MTRHSKYNQNDLAVVGELLPPINDYREPGASRKSNTARKRAKKRKQAHARALVVSNPELPQIVRNCDSQTLEVLREALQCGRSVTYTREIYYERTLDE